MKFIYVGLIVLMCIVIEIRSEGIRSVVCNGCQHGYIRIKRAKFYSSPPLRFYNRPPMIFPIKGAYSLTPPPGYLMDDDRQPNLRPKVSKRPTNEAIGDKDINNVMKFLSNQDLDKLMEFANEQEKESQKYSIESFERPHYITTRPEKYNSKVIYSDNDLELYNDNKFSRNGPFVGAQKDFKPYSNEYNNPNINELKDTKTFKFPELEPSALFINKNNMALNILPNSNRELNQQFASLNVYAHQELNGNRNGANVFSDGSTMQEEQLPKPSNLREDDFEVSFTNNVPTVIKADSGSYKVENLGELPLMNYHSKLDTVDSYRVPHYTVTSPEKYGATTTNAKIPVEPAPPASTAQEQSDAHLKAIKIWTHKSKGTAYTLHDDGTLSLEKPLRPKTNYGYS